MSIINDALKKAQQNMPPEAPPSTQGGASGATAPGSSPQLGDERFSKPAGPAPAAKSTGPTATPAGQQPPPQPQKSKKRPQAQGKKSRTLLWIGLVVAALLALAAGLSKMFGQWPFGPDSRQASSAQIPESPDGLHVSGIMTMGDKRVALINDEIYELGDIVNGMRIVEIEKDKIHLSYGNQQTKILKVYGN